MLTNPGYYQRLLQHGFHYPNPQLYQIELDLGRTFPNEKEKAAELIVPLRRVLGAFVQRCPTIGYCQGFNFIAARLLSVMPEEEAFWTLVQVVEVIFPLDYYSNLIGVLLDIKVFKALLQKKLPKLCEHLTHFQFDLDLLLTKWFVCLFVN
jgi:hypothetical protein